MKIPKMVAIAWLGMMAASAGEAGMERNLTIYVENGSIAPFETLAAAKMLVAKMFASIGVRIQWCTGGPTVSQLAGGGALVVHMTTHVPETFLPGAVALSHPYEGVNITVYWDRMKLPNRPGIEPAVFAHVLVHEITHMLQGIARHSDSGIMKVRWTLKDQHDMLKMSLPFASEDVELIRCGLEKRAGVGLRVAGNPVSGGAVGK